MANIRVICPTCKAELEIDSQYLGQEVECGSCLQVFTAKDPNAREPAAKKPYKARRDPDEDDDRPRKRRRRRSDDYYDDDYAPPARSGGNTAAVFSLVLGILSVTVGCCWCVGLPLSIGGLIAGSMGMKKEEGKGMAVAGMVLSAIGLLFSGGVLAFGLAGNGGAFAFPNRFR
jgi:predicted Zn finger-like uncharacterized protein